MHTTGLLTGAALMGLVLPVSMSSTAQASAAVLSQQTNATQSSTQSKPTTGTTGVAATGTAKAAQKGVAAAPPRQRARYVILYNKTNDRCADIPDFGKGSVGEGVAQFVCRPGMYDNQQVRIAPVGKYGRFLIQTRVNGSGKGALCYDLPNFGKVPKGTVVSLFNCRPHNDNQLFYLRPVKGGNLIVHNVTGMCLDVAGDKDPRLNAPLTLWPCDTKDDHVWGLPDPRKAPVQPLP